MHIGDKYILMLDDLENAHRNTGIRERELIPGKVQYEHDAIDPGKICRSFHSI